MTAPARRPSLASAFGAKTPPDRAEGLRGLLAPRQESTTAPAAPTTAPAGAADTAPAGAVSAAPAGAVVGAAGAVVLSWRGARRPRRPSARSGGVFAPNALARLGRRAGAVMRMRPHFRSVRFGPAARG